MTAPFLFLDVDGVLNTRPDSLDEDKLELLRQIVAATGCEIILSSTWRKTEHQMDRLTEALAHRGMEIFDTTPILEKQIGSLITAAPRWQEIQHYLNRWCGPDGLCILDDERDFGPLAHCHVRTESDTGLTPDLATLATSLLKDSLALFRAGNSLSCIPELNTPPPAAS